MVQCRPAKIKNPDGSRLHQVPKAWLSRGFFPFKVTHTLDELPTFTFEGHCMTGPRASVLHEKLISDGEKTFCTLRSSKLWKPWPISFDVHITGGFKHVLFFHTKYGMSSSPSTFQRVSKNHQAVIFQIVDIFSYGKTAKSYQRRIPIFFSVRNDDKCVIEIAPSRRS